MLHKKQYTMHQSVRDGITHYALHLAGSLALYLCLGFLAQAIYTSV